MTSPLLPATSPFYILHPTSYILHSSHYLLPPASYIRWLSAALEGARRPHACMGDASAVTSADMHACTPQTAHMQADMPFACLCMHTSRINPFPWTQDRACGASEGVERPYGRVGSALRPWPAVGASTGSGSEGQDRPRVRSGGVFTAPGGLHLAHTGQGRVLDAIPMRF